MLSQGTVGSPCLVKREGQTGFCRTHLQGPFPLGPRSRQPPSPSLFCCSKRLQHLMANQAEPGGLAGEEGPRQQL